ncbi:helix-turn-helix domain-containing protein [Deefgea piscis]|uniref:helix-turn-helix domain-containing protein n=1 Tax=Deefgea piscis TaxID=2739061 RepID=UPI001C7E3D23|nr:helix-turn-helix transcriptional regulator [Deefgea piscis]QZA82355.1 helix-turn-helix transcriptional regulator [Deefgea piscis]
MLDKWRGMICIGFISRFVVHFTLPFVLHLKELHLDYFCFESVECIGKPISVDFEKYENNIAYAIGHSLADYRKCVKNGQQEMANCFGVSIGQYRKYEAGIDVPKMHSAARWSATTGAPLPLLFKYTEYAKFFPPEELIYRPYFNLIAKSNDKNFYSLLSLLSGKPEWSNCVAANDDALNFQQALDDVLTNYYFRVMKNFEAIRHFHNLSRGEMAHLLGVSSATYAKYVSQAEKISISLLLYARAHVALSIDTNWAKTGSTFYSLINKRRKDRTSVIEGLLQKLDKRNADNFQSMLSLFGEQHERIQQLQDALSNVPERIN